MTEINHQEAQDQGESVMYHYPLWGKWFTGLMCLCLTGFFVFWLVPPDNKTFSEHLIGPGVIILIVLLMLQLWMYRNLNQILGYVELTSSSVIQHYAFLHKRVFHFSDIESVKFEGAEANNKGPIEFTLPQGKPAWLGFLILLFTPGGLAILGQIIKPKYVLLGFGGNKYKKIENLIDGYNLAEQIKSYCNPSFQENTPFPEKYHLNKGMGLLFALFLAVAWIAFLAISALLDENQLTRVGGFFSDLMILVIGTSIPLLAYIAIAHYQRRRDYAIYVKSDHIAFADLTELARYHDPAGCVPHFFRISLAELKQVVLKTLPYTYERRRREGIIFESNCWRIEIYDEIPNSELLVESVEKNLQRCNLDSKKQYSIQPIVDELIRYRVNNLWNKMTFLFWGVSVVLMVICVLVLFVVLVKEVYVGEIFKLAFLGFPLFTFFSLQKSLALYMHKGVYAELEGKTLRFGDTGPGWMRWWNDAYDLPKGEIDLSNLKQVVYRPYPQTSLTSVQHNEVFELKFTKGKSVWFYNTFENGGDLFNRLVDIARDNWHQRHSVDLSDKT